MSTKTETEEKNARRLWTHGGREKGGYRRGWHWGSYSCFWIEISWEKQRTPRIGIEMQNDGESYLVLCLAIPFLACYLAWDGPLGDSKFWRWISGGKYRTRELSISAHDKGIFIHYGRSGECRDSPYICLRWLDWIAGRMEAQTEKGAVTEISRAVPEGFDYPEQQHLFKCVPQVIRRRRRRFGITTWKNETPGYNVTVEGGIPHPGKGTAGYNCAEDALISAWYPGCQTPEEASNLFVRDVLKYRKTYPL